MSGETRGKNRLCIGRIPTGEIAAVAHEVSPYVHMTEIEVAREIRGFVAGLYERDGLEVDDSLVIVNLGGDAE